MAKTQKRPVGRPHKKGSPPGLFQKVEGGTWFLRHTVNKQQLRVSLGTKNLKEALDTADLIRGRAKPARASGSWNAVIEQYLREKQNSKRPPNYRGRSWKIFRPGTVKNVRSCLKLFADWSKVDSPSKVTLHKLEKYLEHTSKTSNAGGRTTLATINAFLAHIECLPGRVQLPSSKELERRDVVVTITNANTLIDDAETENLKFILNCGFHAGLRKGEIMHATPDWFDLQRGILRVPRIDEIGTNRFRIKDDEPRQIPLSAPFIVFLNNFLPKVSGGYCLKNPRKRKSKTGTYDFKYPFKKFMEKHGMPKVTPHAMRHSWISELCNSGNHLPHEVAAWSGDTLETIEKHYWHKKAIPGALDETMAGVKTTSEERTSRQQIAQMLQLVTSGAMSPSLALDWFYGDPLTQSKQERGMFP